MTLKKNFWTLICAALFVLAMNTGCTNKNENKADTSDEESMSLSANDTTKVIELMNQYFALLQKKDFDGAKSMVFQLQHDSLQQMDPEIEKHYEMGMKIISPIRYEMETMVFNTERDCLVKYSAVLFEKEGDDDKRPNKMFYAIKPVRINGDWYLTVSDKNDMNTRDSKIEQ